MRGQGRRRQSDPTAFTQPNPLRSNPRISPIRRKPIPSTVYEGETPQLDHKMIHPAAAESSAIKSLAVERNPPTPENDDTPYVHFALDQLTRDEEVRGSRMYAVQSGSQQRPVPQEQTQQQQTQQQQTQQQQLPYTLFPPMQPLPTPPKSKRRRAESEAERPNPMVLPLRVPTQRQSSPTDPAIVASDAPVEVPIRHPDHSASPQHRRGL